MGTKRNRSLQEIRALEERSARLIIERREMLSQLERLKKETLAIAASNADLRLCLETVQKKRMLLEFVLIYLRQQKHEMAETPEVRPDYAAMVKLLWDPLHLGGSSDARGTAAGETNAGNAADSVKEEEHRNGSN